MRGLAGGGRAGGPVLELGLLAALPPAAQFDRPSPATRRNAAGLVETVAAGAPRFDHGPDGAPLGLLLEGARTNLLWRGGAFGQAPWFATRLAVAAVAGAAPDGGPAWRLDCDGSGGFANLAQTASGPGGQTYTASVHIRAGTLGRLALRCQTGASQYVGAVFDLAGGAPAPTDAQAPIAAAASDCGGGWRRIAITVATAEGFAEPRVFLYPVAGSFGATVPAGGNILAWGAQLERGGHASSYIPTAGGTALRAADSAALAVGAWPGAGGTLLAAGRP
ncbi:MAG TPA: hypothetical protein VEH84_11580, partial [Alphaproteobacteria bacterium]|nr:hypothetical protein [Alphaproteobacteria bacterium]